MVLAVNKPQANVYGIGFEVGNRYAFGLTNTGGSFWPALYGAPKNWAVANGKFTKDFETEQFKAGGGVARANFSPRPFAPNTPSNPSTAHKDIAGPQIAICFS